MLYTLTGLCTRVRYDTKDVFKRTRLAELQSLVALNMGAINYKRQHMFMPITIAQYFVGPPLAIAH